MDQQKQASELEKKLSPQVSRWGMFLSVFTPLYIIVATALFNLGDYLAAIESHRLLFLFGLILIYAISGISFLNRPDPIKQILDDDPEADLPNSDRQALPLLTDEIDILVETMAKMQKTLKKKNAELVESREKMQELARTTLRAQEVERRYISRELHDQAGQLLVSLRYSVQSLISDLPPANEAPKIPLHDELQTRLSYMLIQIDKTLNTVRALSHKMRPALLDVGDINLAMQEYCSEFQEGKRINIEYKGAAISHITEDTAIALFRFLQESLTNVLKHAEATHVWVTLTCEDGWVQMKVEDNGRGELTDPGQKGIGIIGMKERFHLLGGTVEAYPSKNGFIITAQAPL